MTEETTALQAEDIPEIEETATETEVAEVTEETQDAEPSDEEKAEAERQRKKEKTQRRINQLTREKKEAQAEAEKLRRELAEKSQVQPPNPDNFETQEDYIDAQVAYRLSQEKKAPEPKQSGPDFGGIVQAGRDKFADFDQVAMSDPNLTQQVAETVALAENADEIFYHLGKNPVELERISLLDTAQMAREIGKLEATVTIPAPRTSKAPEPVKPVEEGTTTDVDESKLSMEEWAKRRNKQRWAQGKI